MLRQVLSLIACAGSNFFAILFRFFFLLIILFHSPKLFHDRLSRPLEMLLKGEAKYIVSGRALRQDFTLELNAQKATGKVRIGGKMNEVISI